MTEKEMREWKAKQKKGRFSFVLEQAFKFTPLFMIPRGLVYYFLGEKPFGIGLIFEWLVVSFFTSWAVCGVNWYFQQRRYEKSLSQSSR